MNIKIGDKVKYDGEKHLVVNILKDGSLVLVPMSVIDDECYAVGIDELVDQSKHNTYIHGINNYNMEYKFNFYISGKFKFSRTYQANDISAAWKMAHSEANNYPSNKFIEIANIN